MDGTIKTISRNPKNWIVAYVKPRTEKRAAKCLDWMGIEYYCPLQKVRRKWNDRFKLVELPVFNSYVFVKPSLKERVNVLQLDQVLNFVKFDKVPAIMADEELRQIKSFIESHEGSYFNMSTSLEPGDSAEVESGPFCGKNGIVVKREASKVFMKINFFNAYLIAEFQEIQLKRTPKKVPFAL